MEGEITLWMYMQIPGYQEVEAYDINTLAFAWVNEDEFTEGVEEII